MQIFGRGANSVLLFALSALAALPVVFVGIAYWLHQSSYITNQDIYVHQPIPFSHEHHVSGDGIDCRYCHTSVEKARFAGIPPTETCMTCHSQIWTNAEMLAPVRASLARNEPIHWNRVHNLPGYVYFDHSVHVTNGIGCSTCHGHIEKMPLVRQAEPLNMSWCLSCHRDPTPYLRPRSAIFDQSWTPPKDQAEQGKKLLAEYHIDLRHLTDCSRCHR